MTLIAPAHHADLELGTHTVHAHSDDGSSWWVTSDQHPEQEWLLVPRPGQHTHLVLHAAWDGRAWDYTVVDTATCDGDAADVAAFVGDYALLAESVPRQPAPAVPRALALAEAQRLAGLVLAFGEVERGTVHPDGRRETDTTHTVMLALLALRAHAVFARELDLAELLTMALVHDLVEVYAGDVDTVRALSPEDAAAKKEREAAALARIAREFPWLATHIRRYEAQDTREAVLVRTLDKVLPRLVHLASDCTALVDRGLTESELARRALNQMRELRESGAPTEALDLLLEASVHQGVALTEAIQAREAATPEGGSDVQDA